MSWTDRDVPDLSGRTALVTGPTSGIGLETARVLAEHGARVILGCRDTTKADQAIGEPLALDLADLDSVRAAAKRLHELTHRLDVLVNNAGVMTLTLRRTPDGREAMIATNHLGHFALTGLVLDLLLATPGARVVTVSSNGHHMAQLDNGDLHWRNRPYKAWAAYGASKLANLLFTFELDRRLASGHHDVKAIAAHPGAVRSNLGTPQPGERLARVAPLVRPVVSLFLGDTRMGAWPALRAATDPDAQGGTYYGPDGFKQMRGHPVVVETSAAARDEELAGTLWTVSERETGVTYPC